VYGGWLAVHSEDPKPAQALDPLSLPDLGNGPHFFYGLQWWFFGLLASGGFGYLAWDERRKLVAGQSQSPEHPAVDREHRAGDEARSG
jgi:cytochrome oxidase assembly protein ShyY1